MNFTDHVESPEPQKAQEIYLLPRNCFLRITSVLLRPSTFERNQKLRFKFSIPNSTRVAKTNPILIDDNLLQELEQRQNASGFAEFPIDISAVLEYRHDVRFRHASNLEIELEVVTSILQRVRTIGTAKIDMAKIIQQPIHKLMILFRDKVAVTSMKIQLHSLCISQTLPSHASIPQISVSDSDSEIICPPQADPDIIQQPIVYLVDMRNIHGQIFKEALPLSDSIFPVLDLLSIQQYFDLLTQANHQMKTFIVGDDNFICFVIVKFLFMRDRGVLSDDQLNFAIIPLSAENSILAHRMAEVSDQYGQFLADGWLSNFQPDSTAQNIGSVLGTTLAVLEQTELRPVRLVIADVLLATTTDQFVVPMILDLQIGDEKRLDVESNSRDHLIQMKGVFTKTGKKIKTKQIHFHHFRVSVMKDKLQMKLREMTNSNKIPMIQKMDKFSVEESIREADKISLSLAKGQPVLTCTIGGIEYKEVMGLTITMRDPEGGITFNAF